MYEVIKEYVDKFTLEERKIGDKIDLTAERAKELKDYVKKVQTKKTTKKTDE